MERRFCEGLTSKSTVVCHDTTQWPVSICFMGPALCLGTDSPIHTAVGQLGGPVAHR